MMCDRRLICIPNFEFSKFIRNWFFNKIDKTVDVTNLLLQLERKLSATCQDRESNLGSGSAGAGGELLIADGFQFYY